MIEILRLIEALKMIGRMRAQKHGIFDCAGFCPGKVKLGLLFEFPDRHQNALWPLCVPGVAIGSAGFVGNDFHTSIGSAVQQKFGGTGGVSMLESVLA